MELQEQQVRSIYNQSQNHLDALVRKITTLSRQYDHVQSSIQSTIKKTEKIEQIKLHKQQLIEQRLQKQTSTVDSIAQKQQHISQMKLQQEQSRQEAIHSLQENKKLQYQRLKEESEQYRIIAQEKLSKLQENRKMTHDLVQLSEADSKNQINQHWMSKMQFQRKQQDRVKQSQILESSTNTQESYRLGVLEGQLLQKLAVSQQQQNAAADRLFAAFTLPTQEYLSKFSVTRKRETPKSKKGSINRKQSFQKITVYNEPQVVLDPIKNKLIRVLGLPKIRPPAGPGAHKLLTTKPKLLKTQSLSMINREPVLLENQNPLENNQELKLTTQQSEKDIKNENTTPDKVYDDEPVINPDNNVVDDPAIDDDEKQDDDYGEEQFEQQSPQQQ